ncbi:MAG: electron transfer flavoprotein subunit alpha [Gemmatimonadetes bacterium]|nr:electron transfer flavoprotein subunit alpha [Gemmatimonadota bacterium]NIO30205.1 electron transfer flavoprotein subunit alpha [Gemmatimonadota bacterium]
MEKVLFLAHTDSAGALPKAALEVLGGAMELAKGLSGAPLTVGLVGGDLKAAADSIAGCGAESFLAVGGDEFAVSRYATDAAAAEALVRKSEATLVIVPATSRFSRTMPGVAQRVDGRIDTHVTGFEIGPGSPQIERWYYRQRMVARLSRQQRPWFTLVDSGVFDAVDGLSGSAALESVTVDVPATRTRVVGEEAATAEAQTIRPDAELLFVAGAGWTKKQADGQSHLPEAEQLILDFLGGSQASLGSSKSLVDQSGEGQDVLSFMSHMNQVGQTGSTPRHPKGLATCCHGEEPHVVGWRFIKERRAVNLDPGCGWAQGKADVLYVADAFEVMAKVNELLGG